MFATTSVVTASCFAKYLLLAATKTIEKLMETYVVMLPYSFYDIYVSKTKIVLSLPWNLNYTPHKGNVNANGNLHSNLRMILRN